MGFIRFFSLFRERERDGEFQQETQVYKERRGRTSHVCRERYTRERERERERERVIVMGGKPLCGMRFDPRSLSICGSCELAPLHVGKPSSMNRSRTRLHSPHWFSTIN
ncbi:hypothetical protein AMTRI_Chr03g56100 [Amborella trichopoda]